METGRRCRLKELARMGPDAQCTLFEVLPE